MAAFQKIDIFQKDITTDVHDWSSDTFKIALTNTAPNAATVELLSDITEIAETGGYTFGGYTLDNVTLSETGGVGKVVIDDETITAVGGVVGPFRYLIVNNATAAGNPLCWFYDYGASLTLANGESVSVDFDGTNGAYTIS